MGEAIFSGAMVLAYAILFAAFIAEMDDIE